MATYVCSYKFDIIRSIFTHETYVFMDKHIRSGHISTGFTMIDHFVQHRSFVHFAMMTIVDKTSLII
jgi:hypothetical protein